MKVFVQDPSLYLNLLGLSFVCAVDGKEPAILDSAHLSRVNWEMYFACGHMDCQKLAGDTARYMGALTDPVLRKRFTVGTDAAWTSYNGRTYYFLSDSSRAEFVRMPDMYANASYEMMQ